MAAAALKMQGADALRPRPPGGMGRGAALALAVHVLLVAALAAAVNWRSQTPQTFSAELWAATPQVAAPRAIESTPVAPPPPAAPVPQPRPAPAVPAVAVEAQIAIEKERRAEKERAERDKQEREKLERAKAERAKLERVKAERDKAERERAERDARARADAKQRELQEQRDRQADEQRLAKQRDDNLKRMLGQAGASGAPGATGTALTDAAPSASYAGKLIARIKPNILLTESVSGNPAADVEVRASPSGTILSRRLMKSSGNKDWDEAVLRAIDRTGELPRDVDGRVPPVLVITFTP
jgi:colicin import membrane protein